MPPHNQHNNCKPPSIKEESFDYNHITQHIEQLKWIQHFAHIVPTIRYFCSPEPVVQESYKKKLPLEQSSGAILSMDINPTTKLPTPYATPAK